MFRFVFFLEGFGEGGEECPLVRSEVPVLECRVSKLKVCYLGEVMKSFFHNVHSKEDTEPFPKMEPLEGHSAVPLK